jgi:hypothetical protein
MTSTTKKIDVGFLVKYPTARGGIEFLNSNKAADLACQWRDKIGDAAGLFAIWHDAEGNFRTHQIPITTQRSTRKMASDTKKMIQNGEPIDG